MSNAYTRERKYRPQKQCGMRARGKAEENSITDTKRGKSIEGSGGV